MAQVLIGSKLPNGLILKHPLKPTVTVTVRGLNSAPAGSNGRPILLPYVTTTVDKDFWDAWLVVHNNAPLVFAPLKSGAIFEAKNEDAAKQIAKDREKDLTGLHPMDKEGDPRMGREGLKLKPAEKD